MYAGKSVFSQVMEFMPSHTFRRCVQRYHGDRHVKQFTCLDQFLCMAFAQITYRESLRDIEVCLRSQQSKLYHMGIRGKVSKSTLADANEKRDWRIYADFAHSLIQKARRLYQDDEFSVNLQQTAYALDSSTIDLCLSVFPWAKFRKTKSAIKLHTLLDLRGNIPSFIHISDGKLHDVNILDQLIPEPGSFYVMDRGYLDFARLFTLNESDSFFVIRAKSNLRFRRLYSRSIDKNSGLRCDQTIVLTGNRSQKAYPAHLRRVKFNDVEKGNILVFLTNDFTLSALTIAALYRSRWQVELFFKWIKQHLRIKKFYGTSENAVKTQIWTAISVYVLVAIIKKELKIDASLYTILQILSVTVFEKSLIDQLLGSGLHPEQPDNQDNQLNLFDY
ncbi:MAG: IS4 family transposase [Magnetococcales bacterium]|nr:IS4 family transposase [Magnetococcales bacterium]